MSEETPKTATKTTRRKTKQAPAPAAEPEQREGGATVKKLDNGRTRVTYPNGITIEK